MNVNEAKAMIRTTYEWYVKNAGKEVTLPKLRVQDGSEATTNVTIDVSRCRAIIGEIERLAKGESLPKAENAKAKAKLAQQRSFLSMSIRAFVAGGCAKTSLPTIVAGKRGAKSRELDSLDDILSRLDSIPATPATPATNEATNEATPATPATPATNEATNEATPATPATHTVKGKRGAK